jgi:hypothetical protein
MAFAFRSYPLVSFFSSFSKVSLLLNKIEGTPILKLAMVKKL